MASLGCDSGERGATYRVLLRTSSGKRHTIRLGRVSKKIAETARRMIELLESAKAAGHSPERETAEWVGRVSDAIHDRLFRAGLVPPRERVDADGYRRWLLDNYAPASAGGLVGGHRKSGTKTGTIRSRQRPSGAIDPSKNPRKIARRPEKRRNSIPSTRLELVTFGSGGRRSIQLSYEGIVTDATRGGRWALLVNRRVYQPRKRWNRRRGRTPALQANDAGSGRATQRDFLGTRLRCAAHTSRGCSPWVGGQGVSCVDSECSRLLASAGSLGEKRAELLRARHAAAKLDKRHQSAQQHRKRAQGGGGQRMTHDLGCMGRQCRKRCVRRKRTPEEEFGVHAGKERRAPLRRRTPHHAAPWLEHGGQSRTGDRRGHVCCREAVAAGRGKNASGEHICPPEPSLEGRRRRRCHGFDAERFEPVGRLQRHIEQAATSSRPAHACGYDSASVTGLNSQGNDRRNRRIVKPSDRGIGPAVRGTPSGGEHVDHIAAARGNAHVHAAHEPCARGSLDKPHFLGNVPGIVVGNAQRDHDLAVSRSVLEDADERVLERRNIGGRNHDRKPWRRLDARRHDASTPHRPGRNVANANSPPDRPLTLRMHESNQPDTIVRPQLVPEATR